MKNLILLVAMGICLAACTSTSEKKKNENIDLVKSYVKAVEDLDFDAMEKFLADNYLGMGPSYGDSIGKADAIENWKSHIKNLYEKIHYNRSRFAAVTIPDGDNKGEWVGNWAELTIVYKDNRGTVTIWANTNYLIENGKIARTITFYNEADALRQLGYKIVPPGDGD
jgi:hypothetical protein